jgi:hypothetical protein
MTQKVLRVRESLPPPLVRRCRVPNGESAGLRDIPPLIRGVWATAGFDRAPETGRVSQRPRLMARSSLRPSQTVPFAPQR